MAGALGLGFSLAPTVTSTIGTPHAAQAPARPVKSDIHQQLLTDVTKDPSRVSSAAPDASLAARAKNVSGGLAGTKKGFAVQRDSAPGVSTRGNDTVVTLPVTGGLVGLSWPANAAPDGDTSVAWRAQQADGSWGPWTPTAVDPSTVGLDKGSARAKRTSTDPFWAGDAKTVQLRYSGAGHAVFARARVEQIDPKADTKVPANTGAPASAPGGAQALAAAPRIYSRAEWGADESLRNGCIPYVASELRGAVVHHDAGTNSYTASQSAGLVRSILAYHTQVNGWCDMGYNVVVDKYGQAFEGRYGGLDVPVQGAHALGFNEKSFGISILGNYETAQPTSAGLDIIVRVLAWRLDRAYVMGNTSTSWYGGYASTRYPNLGYYTLPTIIGHRDVNYTACPGANLYPYMSTIRSRVAALQTYKSSPVYQRYAATGGRPKWGGVYRAQRSVTTGANVTEMSGGARFYTTPRTGIRIIGPGLDASWRNLGYYTWGGFPWTDETSTPSGWYVELEKSKTLTYSRTNVGTWTEGGIRWYWVNRLNGSYGGLGMPIARMTGTGSWWSQRFMGGSVFFNGTTNANVYTAGAIDTAYRNAGFISGRWGAPVSTPVATTTGAKQRFANGTAYWNKATNTVSFF